MKYFLLLIIGLVFSCKNSSNTTPTIADTPYEESWESLSTHNEQPEWLKDAKFGIYFHWGVYSVPAYGSEWYPRNMFLEGQREFDHHVNTYGHPSEFGYHDFVPMFKAENFNAQEWSELFVKAGAKFAGPVAEHHDGFSMWNSEITPWNAYQKGPKKDITKELELAIKDKGLKFITTFHHARNLQRYTDSINEKRFWQSHYPFIENMPTTSNDSELKYLYGNIPAEQWTEEVWFGKLKEVIDQYQPDIIWFDSWLDQIPEKYRQKFCAYYLNEAKKTNKEVVIIRKQNDLPLTCSIDDLEKSRMSRIKDQLWMTDETISTGSWCYTSELTIKPTADLIHVLIDIVSKNGVLLLNISPMANGIIPEDQQNSLLKMGEWLNTFGEAIYGTRPWYVYGEGPTKEPEGSFENHKAFQKIKYSEKDIRYTKKDNSIYAFTLGAPLANDTIVLKSFSKTNWSNYKTIDKITAMGTNVELNWTLTEEGLSIIVPKDGIDSMAFAMKIDLLKAQ